MADGVLDVLGLGRGKLVVEDDQRGATLARERGQLLELAGAKVGARVGAVDLLRQRTDDPRAGRIGQLFELIEVFFEMMARAAAFTRRSYQDRALDRRFEGNRFSWNGGLAP